MSAHLLTAVEASRAAAAVPAATLCRAAAISPAHYRRLLRGTASASPQILRRLEAALARLNRPVIVSAEAAARAQLILATYGGFLVLTCQHYGVSIEEARHKDESARRRSADVRASCDRARQAALYLTNTALDLRQADLARVFDLTRAGVCVALRAVEERRDDKSFDAFMTLAVSRITGRVE